MQINTQAEGIDPDSLPGRIKELIHNIEDELEPRRTEVAETKGREEKEMELMDGSDHAALLADQAHAVLASICSDAERYIHVKLAGKILRDQIESYRRENSPPERMPARTGSSFSLKSVMSPSNDPSVRAETCSLALSGVASGLSRKIHGKCGAHAFHCGRRTCGL